MILLKKIIIEKTSFFDLEDKVIFPGVRYKKFISEIHIGRIELGKPFEIYDRKEEGK